MNLFDAIAVAVKEGWALIAAILYGVFFVQRQITTNSRDIESLKMQRTEDLRRLEKVLDDIRIEIREFHKDLKGLLAKR